MVDGMVDNGCLSGCWERIINGVNHTGSHLPHPVDFVGCFILVEQWWCQRTTPERTNLVNWDPEVRWNHAWWNWLFHPNLRNPFDQPYFRFLRVGKGLAHAAMHLIMRRTHPWETSPYLVRQKKSRWASFCTRGHAIWSIDVWAGNGWLVDLPFHCHQWSTSPRDLPRMVTEMSACRPDWHPTPSDLPVDVEVQLGGWGHGASMGSRANPSRAILASSLKGFVSWWCFAFAKWRIWCGKPRLKHSVELQDASGYNL